MDVQDKIDIFNKMVMTEAEEKKRGILEEIKKELETVCDGIEASKRKECEKILHEEKFKIAQSKNKDYLDASMEAKKSLINLRMQLIDKIANQVVDKLNNFMVSDAYEEYIIQEISDYAEKFSEIQVEIMHSDLKFKDKIISLSKGISIISSKEDFIGGFKLTVHEKHAIYDHSFRSKLDEEIKNMNVFRITV